MIRRKHHGVVNATGRNQAPRFVMLPHYLLRCPAWRALSPNGKAVLLAIWERHNGSNNGTIAFAVRDGEETGLSKDQTSRALSELTGLGFVRCHKQATFRLRTKEARTWELTAEPCGDNQPTKDFMRWNALDRSHQRDQSEMEKNKTQSHQRDAWSHQRDQSQNDEIKLAGLVSPVRPKTLDLPDSRSHQRDTYNIPCTPETGTVQALAASGTKRTRRHPPVADASQLDLESFLAVNP